MLKEKLKKKALELEMSEDELIDKYMFHALNSDVELPSVNIRMSDEDLLRIFKEESEKDKDNFDGKNGNFDELIELIRLRSNKEVIE